MIGCNLPKVQKLALYKTQSREPNYVIIRNHKSIRFFFNILLGTTFETTWGQTFKHYSTS